MNAQQKNNLTNLRLHDLVAKTAHVTLKDTLRVLIALQAISEEYDMDATSVLSLPYSCEKPNHIESMQCQTAYHLLYENGDVTKHLYEIERLR